MSCSLYADEYALFDTSDNLRKYINKLFGVKKKRDRRDVENIKKIVFNDPVVTLIDKGGHKTRIRTQGREKFDMTFGYYLVICKYLSSNDTYSELLAHIYEAARSNAKRINIMKVFLMGKLGVKLCSKIDDGKMLPKLAMQSKIVEKKNYTIDFQEVLNA